MSTINKEELVKYLKDNLDITINLDLKFGTDNISRLNFKQDKPYNNTTIAATAIQKGIRGMVARNIAKKIKPITRGRFTLGPPSIKTVMIKKGTGKKPKKTKQKPKKTKQKPKKTKQNKKIKAKKN